MKLINLVLASLLLGGCVPNFQTSPSTPTNTPPPEQITPAMCGIESCHGLDITCGANVPEMCTMEYRLGDFCREFAVCDVIADQCQLIDDPAFKACKSCVEQCEDPNNPQASFQCEDQCRNQFAPNAIE